MDIVPIQFTCLSFLRVLKMYIELKKKKKRFRRYWVKPHININVRNTYGSYATLFNYFKFHDHEEFHKMYIMTVDQFCKLHEMLKSNLEKSTFFREPISTELQLAITLQ